MSEHAILIVSEQGETLQEILQTNHDHVRVDIWRASFPLFEQLTQETYHLLVYDLSFLTDPTSFFDRLNTVSPHTAVLLLAQNGQREQAIEYLRHGTIDYLLHPIDDTELLSKVDHVLEFQALKYASPPETNTGELLTLLEASQDINHSLQLDNVLRIILSKAQQLTQANLAIVFLTDRHEKLSQLEAVSILPVEPSPENNLLFTLAQEVAPARQMVCYQEKQGPAWNKQALQSTLLLPLVARHKLIGVLALGSKQAFAFSDSQTRWLSIFCDRAAIAMENAQLFQDLSSAYIDLAQSREQILQSRNTLQVLFEGITDDLYIVDQNLTINALNQVNVEQEEYQLDDLVGKSYLSLDWVQSAPELINCIREALETGQENTWIPPKEETQPYLKNREFRIYPIRNRLGQVEQAVIFAQDISERRQWQASLFRSANLAAVGQLAGSVAHQINNPLTIAMANSQLIMLESSEASETHALAGDILKATERIQSIVKNLLEFSNQETYFFVETDLITTIDDALALVMRSLKKINVRVIKDYQAHPRLSASVSHLKLVWMNLLLNARDALTDHTDHPQITISTQMLSEREVKVLFTDNGIGIPLENLEQIFRPFFTTKSVGKALGLGLYSAHMIVEQHNGRISVAGRPDTGTTIEIILPLDNPRDL